MSYPYPPPQGGQRAPGPPAPAYPSYGGPPPPSSYYPPPQAGYERDGGFQDYPPARGGSGPRESSSYGGGYDDRDRDHGQREGHRGAGHVASSRGRGSRGGRGGRGHGRGGGGRDRSERGHSPVARRGSSGRLGERDHDDRTANVERKCRTLFVRNISYEADKEWLQSSFASYGDTKEFFDLVSKRGMIFITYFDLRAAERARDAMHGLDVLGRPIDVHYSLPREEDITGKCDRDKNQGSVLIHPTGQRFLNEMELGRACERFGEVRSVHPARQPGAKIVEFWDSRGAALCVEEMHDRPHQGGLVQARLVWDDPEPPVAVVGGGGYEAPGEKREAKDYGYADRGGRGGGRGGRGGGRGGRSSVSDRESDRGWGNAPGGRYEDSRRDERRDERRSSYNRDDRDAYPPSQSSGRYSEAPPGPPGPPQGDDRLEQARRVQELLANLGSVAAPPAPSGHPAPSSSPAPYAPSYNQGPPPPHPPAPTLYSQPPVQAPPSYTPSPNRAIDPRTVHYAPPTNYTYQPPPQSSPATYNSAPASGPPAPIYPHTVPSYPPPPQSPTAYGGGGHAPHSVAPPAAYPPQGYAPPNVSSAPAASAAPPSDVSSLLAMLRPRQ